MKHLVISLLVALLAGLACGPASVPPSGPGTQWPCGLQWYECPVAKREGRLACCPIGDVCGGPDLAGFQRCEPGYCCYDGSGPTSYGSYGASSADAGAATGAPSPAPHAPITQRTRSY